MHRNQSSISADDMTRPGLTQAHSEKRPSRHADVIDQWDVTGLGKSMWHHSGPYDAAAPSRNDARERGAERAPMAVFDPRKGSQVTAQDSRALERENDPEKGRSKRRSSSAARRNVDLGDNEDGDVVLPTLGTSAIPMTARPSQRNGRKLSASSPGVYGSLQEEYSTSVPTSGGYFPTSTDGGNVAGLESPKKGRNSVFLDDEDEEKRRQKEREQKRRALQAAWGIDERKLMIDTRISYSFLIEELSISRTIRRLWRVCTRQGRKWYVKSTVENGLPLCSWLSPLGRHHSLAS